MNEKNNPDVMQAMHEGSKKKMSEREKGFCQTFGERQYGSRRTYQPDMRMQYGQYRKENDWFVNRQPQSEQKESGLEINEVNDQEIVVDKMLAVNFVEEQLSEILTKRTKEKSEEEQEKLQKNKRLSPYDISRILLETDDWRSEGGILLHYDRSKGFWRMIPKSGENRELREAVPTEFAPEVNKNSLSELYEWLVVDALPFPSGQNADAVKYLNLLDCAVAWADGKTVEYKRKKMYFRSYLNISLADYETARNGSFKKYLKSVFSEDKETKKEFKKFIGLALSSLRDTKLSFILHGPSSTGKSVFLGLLGKLMGPELTASLSFGQLSQDFMTAELLGKSLNISGEISGTNNKRLDAFKSISGRDKMTMAYKFKDPVQARMYCMLVFASNVFPYISDVRELRIFLQRLEIFPFEKVIERAEWIDNLEEVLYEDRGSILQVAMEGLRAWEEDGRQFVESKAMKEKKREFMRECNSFEAFLEEHICVDSESRILSEDLGRCYNNYCIREGLLALSGNVWPVVLKEALPVKAVTIERRDPDTQEVKRNRGYQGIKLVNTDVHAPANPYHAIFCDD